MTMLEVRSNGATPAATGLSDDEKRAAARADWHADNSLQGKTLAERYGMSYEWGRKQRRAAEAEAGGRGTRAAPGRTGGGVPRPEPKPKPAARTRHAPAVADPWPLRAGKMAGFVVVAAVCAVLSYNHIRDLAVLVGLDNPEWVPLGIDGLMVVTTCSLMIDKQAGRKPPMVARLGLGFGIVGTLTANALAVRPGWDAWSVVRMALAIYPPITLAIVLHLVFRGAGART